MMGIKIASIGEGALVAVSGVTCVFIMLACLAGIIWTITKVMGKSTELIIEPYRQNHPKAEVHDPLSHSMDRQTADSYGGTVLLYDTDEKTAACIMAIVSHETGIPPEQLIFHSIRCLDCEDTNGGMM